jgi:DNA-binding response OmpR family regulator
MLTGELLRQGFVVHAFTDGASLLGSLATAVDADLAVLDWDLPRMSGIKLMAELRRQDVNLPVVLLTGKVIVVDQNDRCLLASREALDAYECMAFDQGAVDFIPKSRDREVLVRRLRNVVELVKPKANAALEERLVCDRLRLKPETSRAFWNGVDVDLTLGEYKLVRLLASNAGSFATFERSMTACTSKASSPGAARMAFGRTCGRRSSASATSSAPATQPSTGSKTTPASGTAGRSQTEVRPRGAADGARVSDLGAAESGRREAAVAEMFGRRVDGSRLVAAGAVDGGLEPEADYLAERREGQRVKHQARLEPADGQWRINFLPSVLAPHISGTSDSSELTPDF